MIKAVIFDLDGTLLDTIEDLRESTNYALAKCGYPIRSIEDIRNFVGNGVEKLIERAIPNGKNNNDFEDCLSLMKKYYSINNTKYTSPYEGVISLLQELKSKGIKVAIVSNKFDSAVKVLCNKYFEGLFDIAFGENESCRKKPYSDMIIKVLTQFKIAKNEAILVGDSEVDIQTAKNSGLECISVLWGYKNKQFLLENGAKNLISTPIELLKFI